MIVVGIIGLLAAMAVPNLSAMIKVKDFENDKSTVREALMRARTMATARKECVKVTVSTSTEVDVVAHVADLGEQCPEPLGLATQTLPPFTVSATSTLEQFYDGKTNSPDLVFFPTGGLRSATKVTVSMTTTAKVLNPKVTYTVYPAIGQIRMK